MVPLIFQFCSLASGSSGNSYLVGAGRTLLLIDAGISCKKITEKLQTLGLDPRQLSAVLITHEHVDHIKGAELLSRKFQVPLYTNEKTGKEMLQLMKRPQEIQLQCFQTGKAFTLGGVEVTPFPVSHDAVEPVGFSLRAYGRQISTATDTGCITQAMLDEITDADLLLLEANHDENILKMGKYPWFLKQRILSRQGHLSNEAAGEAIVHIASRLSKPRQILLGHLSKENNFPEMAFETVKNVMEEHRLFPGSQLQLHLLQRDQFSPVFRV